jgi:ribA/ribD-fused uncharacterized protein
MESDRYYFFWKHRLSQWHKVDFVVDMVIYNCCEQYMMCQKALLFGDKETAKLVMENTNPADHQSLGRGIKGFSQKSWDDNKERIVYDGNKARFSQSKECAKLLFSTYPKVLVEASPYDKIWGVGLSQTDPRILNEYTWKGQNLLGKILTKVRDELMG